MTSNTALKPDTANDAALFADVKDRFYAAVHAEPILFHDVLFTGTAMKNIDKKSFLTSCESRLPYEIVLLHSANVDDNILEKMLVLQDNVAEVAAPSALNVIDYKTENEVINHYANGGLGLAVMGVDGTLIGQTMLGFDDTDMTISWLMVDKQFSGNMLCRSMLGLAKKIAESAQMETLCASVRIHNERAVEKFSAMDFRVTGAGRNTKDGARTLVFSRTTDKTEPVYEHMGTRPLHLTSLETDEKIKYLERMIKDGFTVKWDCRAKWFTFCQPEVKQPAIKVFKPE